MVTNLEGWYALEPIMLHLFGRVFKPQVLQYEGAWDKEFFFKQGEIGRTKKEFDDAKKNSPYNMTTNSRNIGELVSNKIRIGEARKKEPASIKFIKGELC